MTSPRPAPDSALDATARANLGAVADRVFPPGDESPGGRELGVVDFVAGQLDGPWGRGEQAYRSAPFAMPDHPGHGWQYDLTPAAAVAAGLAALERHARDGYGDTFAALSGPVQDELLGRVESGLGDFGPVRSPDFFTLLLGLVVEGLFADPKYGANQDGVAWRWIGFPGPLPVEHRLVATEPRGGAS